MGKQKEETYVDYSMIFIILFLLAFGLVMIYSTSSYGAYMTQQGDSAYFFKHQFVSVLIGITAMLFMSYFPYNILKQLSFPIYAVSVVLLIMVGPFGKRLNGAKRWLRIFGVSIQPAEIAKIAVIILTATLIIKLKKQLMTQKGFCVALGVAALPSFLIYAVTHDLSSAIITMGIGVVMLFISTPGYKRYVLAAFSVIAFAAVIVLIVKNADPSSKMNYRFERILAWLDPTAHASGRGFQTLQALYAIGSGGFFGKGLGESMQKLGFIPEPQNDMIFSIICEELGLFGAIAVMLMFLILIWRLMIIANNSPDMFGALLVIGVMGHIAIQVILNIAVATNTIPNTGITLPFISYGGTAVIFQLAEIGIALNVGRNIGR
ncbi:MAG: cell division protein FtsW [Butyrivibrio sp.]|nr:cell division protein FtsW [Butyrivibrio sp.]